MATVNWAETNYGFDFNHIIQRDLGTVGTFSGNATSVTVIGTMDGVLPNWPEFSFVMSDIYYGNFQYGPLTEPISGTINTIERQSLRIAVGQIAGLNISLAEAKAVAVTASRDDNAALFAREFAGDDQITTSSARDLLEGFAGNDLMSAGAGNDTLYGGSGFDTLTAGDGDDLLYGMEDNDRLSGDVGNDTLDGGSGDDYLDAGHGNDRLDGGIGLDALLGGDDNDSLYGQGGRDLLTGGRGSDKLYGGVGNDAFIFSSIKDSTIKSSGRDTIYDFSSRQKDKIDLRIIDANTKAKGNQAFKFIDKQDSHKRAGELQWEKVKGGVYVYGDVTGDGKADFSIFLKGLPKISKGDFFL
jgi:Ca2+-binding RTX toxin-like protein